MESPFHNSVPIFLKDESVELASKKMMDFSAGIQIETGIY